MSNRAKYITLTEENFHREVLESGEPVLIDFWASWCGPCNAVAPIIEELAAEFERRAKVAKLNIDDHPSMVMKYGIRSIPALLFFKDGEVADRVVGAGSKKVLADKLQHLSGSGNHLLAADPGGREGGKSL